MSVCFFAPYSSLSSEATTLYALANYLETAGVPVTNVRCNGCLATCAKDIETNWSRTISTCQTCMHEQNQITQWGEFACDDLSPFVDPELVLKVREILCACDDKQLRGFEYMGLPLFEIVASVFESRFGSRDFSVSHPHQVAFLRRLYGSVLRMHVAWDAYLFAKEPELLLTTCSNDFFVMSALLAASQLQVSAFALSFDELEQAVVFSEVASGKKTTIPVFFSDIYSVRPDVNTWPAELVSSIAGVAEFIGLSDLEATVSRAQAS
ncbi:MAG: hypothetical protein KDD62_00150 [Bdellovibrionales bacterium]|nr:hypothetical protein [Bdellovibrionales bacterium]